MNSENNNQKTMRNKPNKTTVKKDSRNEKIKNIKFRDLEGKFLHIKVGNSESPASVEQISDIQKKIISLFEKNNVNCLAFVTHHAVSIDIIKKESNGV